MDVGDPEDNLLHQEEYNMFKKSFHSVRQVAIIGILVAALLLSANPAAAPIIIATVAVEANPLP